MRSYKIILLLLLISCSNRIAVTPFIFYTGANDNEDSAIRVADSVFKYSHHTTWVKQNDSSILYMRCDSFFFNPNLDYNDSD